MEYNNIVKRASYTMQNALAIVLFIKVTIYVSLFLSASFQVKTVL